MLARVSTAQRRHNCIEGRLGAARAVEEIKRAIEQLPKEDFWKRSGWVARRHEDEWDRQIEADIRGGKLDRFAQEALREDSEGKPRPFPE
jgi:hypothetical protein